MSNLVLIKDLVAREILDSRGNPTLQVEILLSNGQICGAAVPAGASTGSHEAVELRDGDTNRYGGLGVTRAVSNVTGEIKKILVSQSLADVKKLDEALVALDGTVNKSRLGANALLGTSLALMRAGAMAAGKPLYVYLQEIFGFNKPETLPVPMMNVINGGRHANNGLSFQEFMIVPKIILDGKLAVSQMVRAGAEIFHNLGQILTKAGLNTNVGDEGGYAPAADNAEQVFSLLRQAIKESGYTESDIGLAIDAAASEFYQSDNKYIYQGQSLTADDLMKLYDKLSRQFNLISVEDGLAEDDWDNWHIMTKQLGGKLMLVGDDLFVTNLSRLRRGITKEAANAILIKPNQIGTVSETVATIKEAQAKGYRVIVSHRSGETSDDFIVDLAVAASAQYLKAGAPSRGERVAKYNRLMVIEESIK
ncbi:MAG: phosphopyruvate hydratase [Patescibacteria group bacterium]